MTQPAAPSAGPPEPSEVAALTAWMRRLSGAGLHQASPAELTAFCHAKQNLLTRIEHHHTPPPPMTSQESRVD